MENHEDFLSLSGNIFRFDNSKCECRIDIRHDDEGTATHILRIKSNNQKLRFAYKSSTGMALISEKGSVSAERILDELISLPDKDVKALSAFFEKYGFFIPISSAIYESFSFENVFDVIRRLKMTVRLLGMVQDPKRDYKKLISIIVYLLFSKQTNIVVNEEVRYKTCLHPIQEIIERVNFLVEDETALQKNGSNNAENHYYLIPDSIKPTQFHLPYYSYMDAKSVYDESLKQKPLNFREIAYLYKNMFSIRPEHRRMVEFFYHFQINTAKILEASNEGQVKLQNSTEENWQISFDDSLKQAALDCAKQTLKEEIEYSLGAVCPEYDVNIMSGAWSIPDFISGLYFSLFYMRSNMEIYRKCSNPNCESYFIVSTTNSRRKYCDESCANATAQRMLRKRKKEKT